METEQVITAEEFFEQGGTYPELAIKFAKLHVKLALEAAYNNAELEEKELNNLDDICYMSNDMGDVFVLSKNSILNSYSLDNIK